MPGVNTLRYLESQVTSTSPHVLALVRLSGGAGFTSTDALPGTSDFCNLPEPNVSLPLCTGIELKSRKSRWQAAAVRSASVLVGLQLLVCEALSRVVGWARQS